MLIEEIEKARLHLNKNQHNLFPVLAKKSPLALKEKASRIGRCCLGSACVIILQESIFMALRFRFSIFTAALALPLTACSHAVCLDKYYNWNYERMPLDEAVQKVSAKSSCPIQIDPALTQNKTSHEIHLNRQPYQAMRHMLWGTGLKVSKTETGMTIVSRHPGLDAAEAKDPTSGN